MIIRLRCPSSDSKSKRTKLDPMMWPAVTNSNEFLRQSDHFVVIDRLQAYRRASVASFSV